MLHSPHVAVRLQTWHDYALQASADWKSNSGSQYLLRRACRHMDDYCFPFMRQWTLYEAMLHSPYVTIRLHI